ncbi:hypothetical protein VM1G_02497 [Cytospora mali]|uniref:Uncharacterized protein n=1 Tax=Cytospora mali TaxID=578113 RepID=A0A194VRZ5_CYTMA|nr:hypothetical protein VM1G_02497 [Valsa mali]
MVLDNLGPLPHHFCAVEAQEKKRKKRQLEEVEAYNAPAAVVEKRIHDAQRRILKRHKQMQEKARSSVLREHKAR